MEEVYEFLKETAPTYYLATVEDGNPRVRPFGTIDLYEGRLYIQTGKNKKVYRQILDHLEVELCACAGPKWLRVTGRYEYDHADPAEMAQKLSTFYAQDAIVITRKTKRGEGQMDIVPAIAELHIRPEETCVTVEAVVSAQEPTLNPDHLVAALHQLAPELAPDFAAFTRQEVYTEDMQIFR